MIIIYTAGKISIEHVTIFLSKYLSKGAVDIKLSPGVRSSYLETISEIILRYSSNEFVY